MGAIGSKGSDLKRSASVCETGSSAAGAAYGRQSSSPQPELVIKCTTWQRDSHGLFDYEGKDTERKQFKTKGTFSLMRHNVTVELKKQFGSGDDLLDGRLEDSKEEETPLQQIARVIEKNGGYWIYHQSTIEEKEEEIETNPENKLWHIVKHCKFNTQKKGSGQSSRTQSLASGYRLMPNDIIKLGRVRFKVREIVSPAYRKRQLRGLNRQMKEKSQASNGGGVVGVDEWNSGNDFAPSLLQPLRKDQISGNKGGSKDDTLIIRQASERSVGGSIPICRICLSDEGEDGLTNPLFSPCKCAGTMKYIHLNCLQEWLNSRMIMKETASTKTYFWKNLECELCKTSFPNYVRTPQSVDKDISLHVIQYQRPQSDENSGEPFYIVLESITHVSSKVIHVVNMRLTESAKIGRGHDVDVRITDISVSRLHGLIKKTPKGYFYIQDNHSKFGSLALIRNPVQLKQGDPNFIQAGRSLLELQVKMPIKLLSSCFCTGGSKRISSQALKTGLTSKNGIDYFPEEFILIPKKKKADDDDQIREDLVEAFETHRPLTLGVHIGSIPDSIDQNIEAELFPNTLAHIQEQLPSIIVNQESNLLNDSLDINIAAPTVPLSALPFSNRNTLDNFQNVLRGGENGSQPSLMVSHLTIEQQDNNNGLASNSVQQRIIDEYEEEIKELDYQQQIQEEEDAQNQRLFQRRRWAMQEAVQRANDQIIKGEEQDDLIYKKQMSPERFYGGTFIATQSEEQIGIESPGPMDRSRVNIETRLEVHESFEIEQNLSNGELPVCLRREQINLVRVYDQMEVQQIELPMDNQDDQANVDASNDIIYHNLDTNNYSQLIKGNYDVLQKRVDGVFQSKFQPEGGLLNVTQHLSKTFIEDDKTPDIPFQNPAFQNPTRGISDFNSGDSPSNRDDIKRMVHLAAKSNSFLQAQKIQLGAQTKKVVPFSSLERSREDELQLRKDIFQKKK